MILHDVTRFIQDSLIYEDDTDEGLDFETVYGLYLSWCHVARISPVNERTLSSALSRRGLRVRGKDHGTFTGLRMVGPAARDFVLHHDVCWLDDESVRKDLSRHVAAG